METQKNANAGQNPSSEFTMPEQFVYHEDGHHIGGWLAVPRASLKLLNLEDQISQKSYQHEDLVYLEEVHDMETFIIAYLAYFGKAKHEFINFPYTNQIHEEAPMPSYEAYKKE
jgi:hypothetical protein